MSIRKNFENTISISEKIINNTTENINIMILSSVFFANENTIFVVLPTLFEAQNYYDKLMNVVGEENVLFYPADEMISINMLMASIEFRLERINTIKELLLEEKRIVVTNLNGVLKKQLSVNEWEKVIIKLEENTKIDRNKFVKKLVNMGYKRSYTINSIGEFSVRGSIIDIFPINKMIPVRLDFFDDQIEKIKEFDINTQKSIKAISEVEILPTHELFYNDKKAKEIKDEMNNFISNNDLSILEKEMINSEMVKMTLHEEADALMKYISFFKGNKTILDFSNNKRIYYIDIDKLKITYDNIILHLNEYSKTYKGKALIKLDYLAKLNYHDDYQILNATAPIGRDGNIYQGHNDLLIKDLIKNKDTKKTIIAFNNKRNLEEFKKNLLNNHIGYNMLKGIIKEPGIYLTIDEKALNFDLYKNNLLCLTEENLYSHFERKRKIRYKSVFGESKRVKTVDELEINDYVVHYDQGIGKYLGIETMDFTGVKRDYIKIMYANNDNFYVPIEQISLIGKYMSSEGSSPRLTKLGSASWEKTKQRVKNKINDISKKLISLYAERKKAEGFQFLKDSTSQIDFESDFEYEETKDQLKTIVDMKKDMESKRPTDRLICGDVGYGKTEIAMRGAFKAVMSGKQVAYLAPTTVLVRQHYNTFLKRFNKFGAKVEMLNRFVSFSKQKEIIKNIKAGSVDIVIGTHRLLSKDIKFKDLGFLIIDEEQRFGVEHKERIKELKVNVDTITLTATPIPRTLQMSLLGIKDLSMIETPPQNRYPIQTYVLERNDTVIKEAILKELVRGGQVFYLYNRVATIIDAANKIQKLVPEAKITIAHGQMNKDELEERISSFINGEQDILVCTTIIETGIDIPNTNTLIIHDASILGLSQLYQIRGRVGRSDKIAYSYLMYDKGKMLTDEAKKRLKVIKDFTELGSGFKIAMRDLSIRGAGDLLGSDQSGFIDSVGLDLYMKILEDAIHNKKSFDSAQDNEVHTSRYIDKDYINDDSIRITIHKRIDKINCIDDLNSLLDELKDRFGSFNKDLEKYMYERLFKNLSKKLEIEEVKKTKNKIELIFSENTSQKLNGEKLFINSDDRYYRFSYLKEKIHITINITHIDKHWLIEVTNYLMKIL